MAICKVTMVTKLNKMKSVLGSFWITIGKAN